MNDANSKPPISEDLTALDPEVLRQVMRHWATGVTVVTSANQGQRHGMTVNSFTSVSLDPAVVLVSLANFTHTHALVAASGAFAVTILADDQGEIADRFAGRHPEIADRFEGLETFTLETGAPLIAGGLAYLDCRVISTVDVGTTTVFFGAVVSARAASGEIAGSPLAYFNRLYRRLQP